MTHLSLLEKEPPPKPAAATVPAAVPQASAADTSFDEEPVPAPNTDTTRIQVS